MVYPQGWVALPVGILVLTDRGDVFEGSAMTMLLVVTTTAVPSGLSRIPTKVTPR